MVGKEGHNVRFITVYRPCQSGGASTVIQQHARAMASADDFRNPRLAILADLTQEMTKWKQLGDHIVLGMDANEDVRQGEVHDMLSSIGLREVILELHNDQSPPRYVQPESEPRAH
jgi:hypothetical protein